MVSVSPASGFPLVVVNAGSSSLKLRTLGEDGEILASRDDTATTASTSEEALVGFLEAGPPPALVAHRVVHGGPEFGRAVVIDDSVMAGLERLTDLAPLHNPPAIRAIATLRRTRPELAQVACFDTSFHAGLPAEVAHYAIPHEWTSRWQLRRYGFHGLSHAYASRRAAELLDQPVTALRLVTAHIGSGASLAAVAGGASVDTTMGFTPMEGLVMATRPGNLDPGLLLWLIEHSGLSVAAISDALEHNAGLLGLSGASGDLREIIAAADAGGSQASLAYGVYVHRLRGLVAAMTAAIGGLDALVFTGGAGAHSDRLRRDTCAGLGFLGIEIEPTPSSTPGLSGDTIQNGTIQDGTIQGDTIQSGSVGPSAVVVVEAREDLEIARQVRGLLAGHDLR